MNKPMTSITQDTPISYGNVVFEYAGNIIHKSTVTMHERAWSQHSEASCYISAHKNLFMSLTSLNLKPLICLPNGTNCSPKFTCTTYVKVTTPHLGNFMIKAKQWCILESKMVAMYIVFTILEKEKLL